MAIEVSGGIYAGHLIRQARKPGKCGCGCAIAVGDLYLEGEGNDTAGGFGRDRLCLDCAGPEAVMAAGGDDGAIRAAYNHLADDLGLMPLDARGYGLMVDLRDLERKAQRTHEIVAALANAKLRQMQPA